jgi:outer membrane protein assembly factor BamB
MSTRLLTRIVLVLAGVFAASPASAQLDPLLFLKVQTLNVILVVDTSARMQRECAQADVNGQCATTTFVDPNEYNTGTWRGPLGLAASSTKHRRKLVGMAWVKAGGNNPNFQTGHIEALDSTNANYEKFYDRTRLAIARLGLIAAIQENKDSARFSLIKTRQDDPGLPSSSGNEKTTICGSSCGDTFPNATLQQLSSDASPSGNWYVTRPRLSKGNESQKGTANSALLPGQGQGLLVQAGTTGAMASMLNFLGARFWKGEPNALVPAGLQLAGEVDSPIGTMLEDARTEALRLIAADESGCRNTVVVLVTGGAEGTINADATPAKALAFTNVSGRRVPIYVIAIAPLAADVPKLKLIAVNSGGEYIEVTKALIDTTALGKAVPEVARGVNRAVQSAFTATQGDQEFQVTSPIVGTVNLKGAKYYTTSGTLATLPNAETDLVHARTGAAIPQRANVLVTSGFKLPSFDGSMRAVRLYKPVVDTTLPSGYKFTQDGSRLWTASTPAAASRNIYTILPDGTMAAFDVSRVDQLMPYLQISGDSSGEIRDNSIALITWLRERPLGAIIGSTPAFLDEPSLDPPPDAAYAGFRDRNKARRSLIFVGANDGMLHAIDGRTGVEVWAFIPFNLLPKLQAMQSGQSPDSFKYYVDGSPKIADVKVQGEWRTYLVFGQGKGGTFYNALDVTLDRMSETVADTADLSEVLTYFAQPDRIARKWSFPRNSSFAVTLAVYGDLATAALDVEKTVGETWSVPAIGQLVSETGPYVVLVGSGFLPRSVEQAPNRGGVRAGRNFYVLNIATGAVQATQSVGADGLGEEDDDCRVAGSCQRIKNALQMDPIAVGQGDSRFITSAYLGDLDGRLWRFDMSLNGSTVSLATPVKLFDAGAAEPMFASMATFTVAGSGPHIFLGTGSEMLPSNGVNTSYRLLVLEDNGGSAALKAEILLEKTDGDAGDEKVTGFPAVAGNIVYFTTTTVLPAQVCSPFYAQLYAFTFLGGPAYDTNNDGKFTADTSSTSKQSTSAAKRSGGGKGSDDDVLVSSIAGVRATAPFIVDQHLVFGAGGKLQMFGDPDSFNNGIGQAATRVLSWRIVK